MYIICIAKEDKTAIIPMYSSNIYSKMNRL